jgi:hypothetical protein
MPRRAALPWRRWPPSPRAILPGAHHALQALREPLLNATERGHTVPKGLLDMQDLRRLILPALRLRPPPRTARLDAPPPGGLLLHATGGSVLHASFEDLQLMDIPEDACGAALMLLQSYDLGRFGWGDATTVRRWPACPASCNCRPAAQAASLPAGL